MIYVNLIPLLKNKGFKPTFIEQLIHSHEGSEVTKYEFRADNSEDPINRTFLDY